MTIPETIASILPFTCFLVALFRARWVALALASPCLLILARVSGLVDIASASHPLRFLVPIVGMSLAMFAAWWYLRLLRETNAPLPIETHPAMTMCALRTIRGLREDCTKYYTRALIASILVFASGCADIPALLAWRLPGEWVLVPLQIAVCLVILVVLLVPERWAAGWLRN